MIELRAGDKILKMSSKWEEVSLGQFIDLYKITQSKDLLTDDIYIIRLIEKLCNVSVGDLDEMSFEDLLNASNELTFLNELPKGKKEKIINLNGTNYVFIENMMKLSLGEYVSIKTLTEELGGVDAYAKILSIICREGEEVNGSWRPKKFVGDIDEIKNRENIFLKQPITLFIENINFFFNMNNTSQQAFQNFIKTK